MIIFKSRARTSFAQGQRGLSSSSSSSGCAHCLDSGVLPVPSVGLRWGPSALGSVCAVGNKNGNNMHSRLATRMPRCRHASICLLFSLPLSLSLSRSPSNRPRQRGLRTRHLALSLTTFVLFFAAAAATFIIRLRSAVVKSENKRPTNEVQVLCISRPGTGAGV